jgi:hypothetical protein
MDDDPTWYKIKINGQINPNDVDLKFFGQDADQTGAIDRGQLFWFSRNLRCTLNEERPAVQVKDLILIQVAMLDTGETAVAFREMGNESQFQVLEFPDTSSFRDWHSSGNQDNVRKRHAIPGICMSFVGGATAFALLKTDGTVLTWGDNHRRWELGRIPEQNTPAEQPAILEHLAGIPIKKIDAQLGLYGALSEYNDLYIWGEATSIGRDNPKLDSFREAINLVDLGEDVNVVDFGLGAAHLLCVTDEGIVYGLGSNIDGQLLTASTVCSEWRQIQNVKASKIVCGYWTTFLF